MDGASLTLQATYPEVHTFIRNLRNQFNIQPNVTTNTERPDQEQMVICGGYPLALLRAIYCNTTMEIGKDFGDFDVFTTIHMEENTIEALKQEFIRNGGTVLQIIVHEGIDLMYQAMVDDYVQSVVSITVGLSNNISTQATIDVITLHPDIIQDHPMHRTFPNIILSHFYVSVSRVYMHNENSMPAAYDLETAEDILNSTFTYHMDTIENTQHLFALLERFIAKGYTLKELIVPNGTTLAMTNATIRKATQRTSANTETLRGALTQN